MKTVAVSARAKTLINILKQAQKGGLILRSPEGREFVITELDEKKLWHDAAKKHFSEAYDDQDSIYDNL
ncbi:MAG: hypothetical protein BWK80_12775 [Desulfobacteraceae bacterium IS3]|jgi:hypothetical protein|nr:MAG: hypothetical protein BWK80_12775 [Desulfobacteraceae bacterium IS3]